MRQVVTGLIGFGPVLLLVAASALSAQANPVAPATPDAAPIVAALRSADPISVDGRLDEASWRTPAPAAGFSQIEPEHGNPARFETAVRVLFDDRHLYLAFVARDPEGAAGIRGVDLRRDFDSRANDFVGAVLGPLGDRRATVAFEVTAFGALQDVQVFDGNRDNVNEAWDASWVARTQRTDSGWTAEIAIPWSSLRYGPAGTDWLVNFYRRARRANELSAWRPWPRQFNEHRLEFGGRIVGLEPPARSVDLQIRPYTVGASERVGAGSLARRTDRFDAGGEVIWSPDSRSRVEGTINTDFAQADVDNEVISLRRFSVFFPERRQFFLENAPVFESGLRITNFVVQPFFSRRIGLDDDGNPVPVQVGGRFVRRGERATVGAMAMRQAGPPGQDGGESTFGVARWTTNLGGADRLGALVATRFDAAGPNRPARRSTVAAVDGFARFTPTFHLTGSLSATTGNGAGDDGLAATAYLVQRSRSWYFGLIEAVVSRGYQPSTGFVSRANTIMHSPGIGWDWRPAWRPKAIRNFRWSMASYVFTSADRLRFQESETELYVDIVFQSGALAYPDLIHLAQRLDQPFEPVPGVIVPPGSYQYWRPNLSFTSDQSRPVSGNVRLYTGGFYDRKLDEAQLGIRMVPSPRFNLTVDYGYNRFHGKGPAVTTHLVRGQLRAALDPRVQLTSTYQYNSAAGRGFLNARFSWEFQPLSFLYLVWNDVRGEGPNRFLTPEPRQDLLVKLVYLGRVR